MNFKTKADAIITRAEQDRKTMKAGGTAKRIYDYWLYNSDTRRAHSLKRGRKENFCHYFWTVVLFSPLLFLFNVLVSFSAARRLASIVAAALVVVSVGLFFDPAFTLIALGVVLGSALSTLALASAAFGGVSLAHRGDDYCNLYWPTSLAKWSLILFPISVTFYLLSRLAQRRGGGFATAVMVSTLVACSLVVLAIFEGLSAAAVALGTLVALAAGLLFFFTVASRLVDFTSRKIEHSERRKEVEIDKYVALHGNVPPKPTREPSRVSKMLVAVKEFIVLVAQIVRAKKTKVCPLIDIDG